MGEVANEMIERVARALFSGSVYHGYNKETLDAEWTRTKNIHMARAKDAIEAMRDPTEAMKGAAGELLISYDSGHDTDEVWRTMIDAALK